MPFVQGVNGDNLIPDGDLKETPIDGRLPAGISFYAEAGNAKASISDVAPVIGGHSFCIEHLTANGNARITFQRPIPVTADGRYYFSCQVKTTEGAAAVSIGFLDANRKSMNQEGPQDFISPHPEVEFAYGGRLLSLRHCLADRPDDFNTIDTTFTVPDGAAFVTISLAYGWSLGSAWYGDFQLLPLD